MSPRIHSLFAQATAQALVYDRECVPRDGFAAAATEFFAADGSGLNITTPFKLDAYQFADNISERARRAGAVNTLIRADDGTIVGDNTDGAGLVADLLHGNAWPIQGMKVLIVGAGGAVRGVLAPLLAEQPALVVLANRTVATAQQLARAFAPMGRLQACGFESIPPLPYDLVINATSAGLNGEVPPVPATVFVRPDSRCYDMIYGASDTAFITWAKAAGCKHCSDGLGMLVGQAAESFYLWRGVRPPQASVIAALRADMAAA